MFSSNSEVLYSNNILPTLEKVGSECSSYLLEIETEINQVQILAKNFNFRSLNVNSFFKLKKRINNIYDLVASLYKANQNNPFIKKLFLQAVSLKLGGLVSVDLFTDCQLKECKNFILKNHFHHKYLALRMQMQIDEEGDPLIPIIISGKQLAVSWTSFVKRPVLNAAKKLIGYQFLYFNHLVFETDPSLKLTDNYTFTYRGIEKHNSYSSTKIIPHDKLNPIEWGGGYVVEVVTLLKDKNGKVPTIGVGDHCHLTLKSKEGYVYSFGKFSQGRELPLKEYFSLFARKKGQFISPDLFVYFSNDLRHFDKSIIRVSEQEFKAILEILEEDRKKIETVFSILKNNCTSYIQGVLKKTLQIEVNSAIFLPKFIIRSCVPLKWQKWIFQTCDLILDKVPISKHKYLYFIPPVYIPTMIIGFFMKIFGLKNRKGVKGEDLTFKDVFFRPWNICIDSPIGMRENLKKLKVRKFSDDNSFS